MPLREQLLEKIKEYLKILNQTAVDLAKLKISQKESNLKEQILIRTIKLPELKERVHCYAQVIRDLQDIIKNDEQKEN
jgi:hypothetical protein